MRKNRKHSFKSVYSKKKNHWESKRVTKRDNTSRRKQGVWKPRGKKECSVFGKTTVAGTVRRVEELRVH